LIIMKYNSGMTFIEILIAALIVAIVMASIFSSLNFTSKYAQSSANKTMALNFAEAKMETIKSQSYANIISANFPADAVNLYLSSGTNIIANRTVGITAYTNYKAVSVTVSWTWQGKNYSEVLNTIIGNH